MWLILFTCIVSLNAPQRKMYKPVLVWLYTWCYMLLFLSVGKIFLKFLCISIVYIKYIRIFVENIKTKRYENLQN